MSFCFPSAVQKANQGEKENPTGRMSHTKSLSWPNRIVSAENVKEHERAEKNGESSSGVTSTIIILSQSKDSTQPTDFLLL